MITVQIPEDAAGDIAIEYLKKRVIIMKQYWPTEIKDQYLAVIKHNSNLLDYEHFLEQYNQAHG